MPLRKLNPQYWAAQLSATLLGWALVVAVCALLALTFVGLRNTANTQNEIIRETHGQAVADAVWLDGHKVLNKIKVEQDEQEREAIEEHRAWADEPVPDSVADILRNPDSKAKQ